MADPIKKKREERGRRYRRKERKEAALADARKHREWQEDRIKMLQKERDEAREAGNEDRVDLLNIKIDETKTAMARTVESIKRLQRVVPNAREAWRKINSNIQRLVRKRKKRRKKKRRKERREAKDDITFTAGSSHWGGVADIFENEVIPAAGVQPHSTKRTATYGNPGSDHHVSQVWAYAGDFPPSVSLAVRIAKRLGIGYNGYADDYKLYYIYREGRQIRIQLIASNHGTGPHVHCGGELS